MGVYRVEIQVYATAYVKARSRTDALAKARKLEGQSPTILDHDGGVAVSGLDYDDPDLPSVSLSPAMTIGGVAVLADAERVY